MSDGLASQALSRREIARLSRLAPLDKALVLILVRLWSPRLSSGRKPGTVTLARDLKSPEA